MLQLEHWKTTSYARHMALGGFYSGATAALDDIVEHYTGMFGPIDDFSVKAAPVDDVVAYLRDEMDWIESNREELSGGSDAIGNLVDVLAAVYAKTIYLLGLK
jgi:hypothetical protein